MCVCVCVCVCVRERERERERAHRRKNSTYGNVIFVNIIAAKLPSDTPPKPKRPPKPKKVEIINSDSESECGIPKKAVAPKGKNFGVATLQLSWQYQ